MNPYDRLKQALQAILDAEGDGWHVKDWICVLGLERFDSAGVIESSAWICHPDSQADYITDGLVGAAQEMRDGAELEED